VHGRPGSRGLGTAIVAGLNLCDTFLVCAMDADLSHPPILIPTLFERLNGCDGTVASRYAVGGRIADWSLHRRIISRVATRIAKSALDIRCADPLSGYFLFRTASVRGIKITGLGNKPLLEILGRQGWESSKCLTSFATARPGRASSPCERFSNTSCSS